MMPTKKKMPMAKKKMPMMTMATMDEMIGYGDKMSKGMKKKKKAGY